MRRILGLLVAVLALGLGWLGSREIDLERARTTRREARHAAETASERATDGLAVHTTDLKLKVENAAANPRLVFALQGNVDERTLRDLWRTEEWWRPWRTEFKVYALALTSLKLDAVEGIEGGDLNAETLVRHVREKGDAAAEVVVGHGWPYAAAATSVKVPGRDRPAVLVLAQPIDQATMRKLADKAGGAVMLTDGHDALLAAGPESERALLKLAVGYEGRGPLFESEDRTWAAVQTPVAPGLNLWTYASGGAAAHEAAATATQQRLLLWVLALGVAGIALMLGLRRSRAAMLGREAPPLLPRTIQGPGPYMIPTHGTPTSPLAVAAAGGAVAQTALATPVPSNGPYTPFGRYMLLDRMGEGGMAEVYSAVTFGAEGFRRKFVVKRLRAEIARESSAVDQFIDEANMASSMVHSNIVPVFDFGKVGDEYFLAQEYILGRDLGRITRRSLERDSHPILYTAALYGACEILKALEYAHSKMGETGEPLGIVHRDVSPSNIIVSARGEVKLFDFGIVKAQGRVTKTESGVVKGNVTFMSPEQARGGQIDGRADLFSLALVIYYVLTGKALYAGSTTYELLIRAASGPGPEEYARVNTLPGPCGPLLRRGLSVRPGDRFQTAREFREAISSHVGGGAAELAAVMQHLFTDDFRNEESRFRTVLQGQSATDSSPGPVEPTVPRRS